MESNDVWPGSPRPLGATFDGSGVNFAVYSRDAEAVDVCLYAPDDPGREIARLRLPEQTEQVFHGYVPGLQPGALYGLRVHGPYEPAQGLRFNPNKLLIDPYARALHGAIDWSKHVFGYVLGGEEGDLARDDQDSAAGCPRGVVVAGGFDWGADASPRHPWRKTILYEAHVRGLTMRHPEVPPELRGTYAGLASPPILQHLQRLGVTAIELLPVHESVDDSFLTDRGLRNYWGYNTLGFFAPEQRYAADRSPGGAVREFREMVRAFHAAGIEVILDVVYNHTCEGNHLGPTLSWKGIDNRSYYWLMPDGRHYLDFTGTGNSLRFDSLPVAQMVADSLRYWVTEMHVDGFRFDLATVLGRSGDGTYHSNAAFFQIVLQDPVLSQVKLIAEPWDVGLGGYQLGHFPGSFREWNGKYRDAMRRLWRGDGSQAGEVGYRLTGSADLYEWSERRVNATINFITCHDGFTLHDLVSYSQKHNEANGELNRDGADDNASWNCGVEGETDDPAILELRARQKRNLLTTLFVSQGVPMLCAGDEIGHSQGGNNNAYCQDNEISWLSWELDDRRRALFDFTRRLIAFRGEEPVLQRRRHFRGEHVRDSRWKDLAWFRPDGKEMEGTDWDSPLTRALAFLLGGDAIPTPDERGQRIRGDAIFILLNASDEAIDFAFPGDEWGAEWTLAFDTARPEAGGEGQPTETIHAAATFRLNERSMAVFCHPLPG
jgi:glycogen operon protein